MGTPRLSPQLVKDLTKAALDPDLWSPFCHGPDKWWRPLVATSSGIVRIRAMGVGRNIAKAFAKRCRLELCAARNKCRRDQTSPRMACDEARNRHVPSPPHSHGGLPDAHLREMRAFLFVSLTFIRTEEVWVARRHWIPIHDRIYIDK